MKVKISIILMVFFLVLPPLFATTYYINPNGSDATGDGSQGNPWKTLSYACTQVTQSGDIIHVKAGTYNEVQQSSLSVGVSIEGPTVDYSYPNFTTSPTAIIQGWSGANPILNLTSASEGTNGNQTIKYIKWDGSNQAATQGIRNYRRKNVEILNCEFVDFLNQAIIISGKGSNGEPTTHATGIKIYDCKFTDCSRYTTYGTGTIGMAGTEGAEIYNVYIDSSTRNGYGVKYDHCTRAQADAGDKILKGLLIHDSELHASPTGSFGFAIELWGVYDDCKVYNNTIEGAVDFDTVGPGSGTYGAQVYNNTIYNSGSVASNDGVVLDRACNGVLVRDNYIYNRRIGFLSGNASGRTVQNISVYRNVFYTIGISGAGNKVMQFNVIGTLTNLNIWNNVFDDGNGGRTTDCVICFIGLADVSNVSIRNNIFRNYDVSPIRQSAGGTINGITITHNYYYNTGAFTSWTGTVLNKTENNNTNADPDLTDSGNKPSPYYQPSGLVANIVDAGADVGLPYEGTAPDIGAYEYGSVNPPLSVNINASSPSGEVPLTINFTGSATGGTEPYTYSWDFGNSTSSSEQNPSYTYNDPGDYTVTLTVTDSDSNQDSDSLIINAYAYVIPLVASCAASPTSGEVPLTVNFTGSATGGVLPYSYNWDFGDSTSSSEQNPTHTYSDPGDYTVTLTVTDSESNQDNDSLIINVSVASIPLEASCAASPTSGEVPLTVNFTGNASGGTPPYSYNWSFGDSTSSSEQIPTHTYSDAGDYTVTLTVTDSQSNQNEDSLIINASALTNPLVASCAASPVLGEVPLTVNFTGSVTGGVLPYSYSWDFGDGTSSSEQNPFHIYSQAGDYTAYFTVTDSESNQDNDSVIISASAATNSAYLSCSPKSLYFGATTSGNETTDQYLRIINAGGGALTWNIEDDADWLSCSPSSGTDRGEITVSVNASGLSLGLYIATITVSSPEAYNSPQYVSVNFRVYEPEQESPPFGSLDTPVNGSTVSGSIPVTGWALDDIEVIRLEIKRNSDPLDPPEAIGLDGLVYIGDAVFVEGARPDVEKSYADYPLNSRAGWGYMLLTNDLPYRGNGSFTIYTFAYDAGGHREEIGRKTILCDNINRVKPFGAIDTPEQGEIIRGSDYINFGWALTPLPKTIPKDGGTIWIWVDGVQIGHPVYDQYREDIATLYPEYNNAQGAVGYYYLDTTQYENGMHTIAWSVMDDEGEVDEIGARYFFIDNIEIASVHNGSFGLRSIYREDAEGRLRIGIKEVRREYRPQVDRDREINTKSILNIQIEEMEPVRIVLEESSGRNVEYIGWGEEEWKALPIGSTLDREKGIFSWIPTPGFIGRYVLHFAVIDGSYMSKPLRVEVNVIPKSYD